MWRCVTRLAALLRTVISGQIYGGTVWLCGLNLLCPGLLLFCCDTGYVHEYRVSGLLGEILRFFQGFSQIHLAVLSAKGLRIVVCVEAAFVCLDFTGVELRFIQQVLFDDLTYLVFVLLWNCLLRHVCFLDSDELWFLLFEVLLKCEHSPNLKPRDKLVCVELVVESYLAPYAVKFVFHLRRLLVRNLSVFGLVSVGAD